MKKKKLLTAIVLTLSAVALIVVSVLGTIAYMTASSAVSNTFTVGNVAIDMWETKVDKNGSPITPEEKVKTNSYHLVPGNKYTKNPTIEILSGLDGGDSMFLYVKSHNGIRNIEAGNQSGATAESLSVRQQMEQNGWVQLLTSGDGKEIVWVYGTRADDGKITPVPVDAKYQQTRFDGNVGPAGQIQLCQYFQIDEKFTDLSVHNSSMVDFVAFAIQASGINDAPTGWEAIKSAHENATVIVNPVNPYDPAAGKYDPVPKQ